MNVIHIILLASVLQLCRCLPRCDNELGSSCVEQAVVSVWSPSNISLYLDKAPNYDLLFVMRSVGYNVEMSLQTPNGSFVLPTRRNASIPKASSTIVAKFVFLRRQDLRPGNYTVHLATNTPTPTLASLKVYVQRAKNPQLHSDDRTLLQLLWMTCCAKPTNGGEQSDVCQRIQAAHDPSVTNQEYDICRDPPNMCSPDGYIQHLYLHNEEPDGKPGLVCDWNSSLLPFFLNLSVLDLSGNSLEWQLSDLLRAEFTDDLAVTDNPTVDVTTGTVVRQPVQLQELYVQNNNMTGGFGDTPSPVIEVLWGFNNSIQGSIPATWLPSQNLVEVMLDNNKLTGTIPPFFAQQGLQLGLQALHLSGNALQGTIPDLIQYVGNIRSLDLSGTNLVGSLPLMPNSIELLNLASNHLNGTIDSLKNRTHLQYLSLGSNKMTGTLPTELATAPRLQVLNLTDNSFSGRLDVSWTGPELAVLLLSKNQFEGPVPVSWPNLPNLEVVQAASNKLTGNLDAFGAAASNLHTIHEVNSTIRVLNLSSNQLTGGLSSSLKYMDVFAGSDYWTRCLVRSWGSRSGCNHVFDVSSNKLSGPFPTWTLDLLPTLSNSDGYTFRIDGEDEQGGGNSFYCPNGKDLTRMQFNFLDLAASTGLECTDNATGAVVHLSASVMRGTPPVQQSSNIVYSGVPPKVDNSSSKKDRGAEIRYIAGMVFGCVLVVAAIVAAILLWLYRTRWYKRNAFHALHEVHTDVTSLQLPQSTSPRPVQ